MGRACVAIACVLLWNLSRPGHAGEPADSPGQSKRPRQPCAADADELSVRPSGIAAEQNSVADAVRLASCLDPVECAFVADVWTWPDEVRRAPSLGARVIAVTAPAESADAPSGSAAPLTPWMTDQWVFGWRGDRPLMLAMPAGSEWRRSGRAALAMAEWPRLPLGQERAAGRFDAGGNILVAPGAIARIVTSAQMRSPIREQLQDALGAGNCRFIELDTSWLKVGHVDEIVGFVPDRECGFRLVVPDYLAGLDLLESVPADRVLFGGGSGKCVVGTVIGSGPRILDARNLGGGNWKYVRIVSGPQAGLVARVHTVTEGRLVIDQSWDLRGESPTLALEAMREWQCETMPLWFEPPEPGSRFVAVEDSLLWLDARGVEVPAVITAGELCRDETLRAVAQECAQRIDGPGGVRETVLRELGMSSGAVLRLPVVARGNADAQNVVALLPNPVNLVCVGSDVLLLRPHGPRREPDEESSDVFARAWSTEFRRIGLNPVFLEGWNSLHRLDGGARCGINVLRRPPIARATGDAFRQSLPAGARAPDDRRTTNDPGPQEKRR